jgi:photosystem II cytochrome c550
MLRKFFAGYLLLLLAVVLFFCNSSLTAQAAKIDSYIIKYLRVTEPIALDIDSQGNQRKFSPLDLSVGKQLFEANCLNCHVGGATLPDPLVPLSLTKLKGANPPRDNINSLVTFMQQPMTYDGSEETYWCRQVTLSMLSQQQTESLAAFVLTAAQKAPGWGIQEF